MKRSMSLVLFLLFVLIVSVQAISAKEADIVVTATRIDTNIEQIASSIDVVSEDDIEERQVQFVKDVIKSIPGLDITQNGGSGGTSSIFIRGANSAHTLVLIDGVEVNDPMDANRSADLAHLTVDNIERIEVIRGAQSTLYGSDAIGGVINIITKKGKGKPRFTFTGEAGTFNTLRAGVGVGGSNESFNYSFDFSHLKTDGISTANAKDGNDETDSYENSSFSGRFGFDLSEKSGFDYIVRYSDAKRDYDDYDGDDPNKVSYSKQLFSRIEYHSLLLNDVWEQKIGVSYSSHDRDYHDDDDAADPSDYERSYYDGKMTKLDWQNNIYIDEDRNILTVGLEREEETGKSDSVEEKTAGINSLYIQEQLVVGDNFFPTIGFRFDEHSISGSSATYRLTSAYLLNNGETKIKATYGTGFKSPSLFQLYSSYGDENLKSEKSVSWDLGIEQSLLEEKITLGATYFRNDFKDLIDYDFTTSKYKNRSEAEAKGVELSAFFRANDNLDISLNYTYTDTKDKETDLELLKRARDKASANINYRFLPNGSINFTLNHVGPRYAYGHLKMDSYTVANLASTYKISGDLKLFGRIDNIFDTEYEEVRGYGTPGVSVFAGAEFSY